MIRGASQGGRSESLRCRSKGGGKHDPATKELSATKIAETGLKDRSRADLPSGVKNPRAAPKKNKKGKRKKKKERTTKKKKIRKNNV